LGCGGVFTAVCTKGKRDLLKRLLDAGIRVPPVVTGCQSYLLEQPDMLRTLLESGMNPDTCNWQHQTLLHMLCGSGRPDKHDLQALLEVTGAAARSAGTAVVLFVDELQYVEEDELAAAPDCTTKLAGRAGWRGLAAAARPDGQSEVLCGAPV
jgi:hypothetical protein